MLASTRGAATRTQFVGVKPKSYYVERRRHDPGLPHRTCVVRILGFTFLNSLYSIGLYIWPDPRHRLRGPACACSRGQTSWFRRSSRYRTRKPSGCLGLRICLCTCICSTTSMGFYMEAGYSLREHLIWSSADGSASPQPSTPPHGEGLRLL